MACRSSTESPQNLPVPHREAALGWEAQQTLRIGAMSTTSGHANGFHTSVCLAIRMIAGATLAGILPIR